MTKAKLFWIFALLVPCWVIAFHYNVDLVVLHAVSKHLSGDLTRVYGDSGVIGKFFYGPATLPLIWPFAGMSYNLNQVIWVFLETLHFALAWFLFFELFPILGKSKSAWFLFFLFAINPIHNNFQSGNIQFMLFVHLLFAEWARRKEEPTWQWASAFAVTLASAIKVFPAFIWVYYFFLGKKGYRTNLLICALAINLTPFLFWGIDGGTLLWKDFFSSLGKYEAQNSLVEIPDILCLPSLLARWSVSSLMIKAVTLFLLSGFLFVSKISGPKQEETLLWALAMALMALVNPSTRVHYFVLYLPAFAELIRIAEEKKSLLAWGMPFTVFTLMALTMEGVVGKTLNDRLERASIPTWGSILLVIFVTYAFTRSTSSKEALP